MCNVLEMKENNISYYQGIISLDQILLSYISNTSHIPYKRLGYVLIPKPFFSGLDDIYSRFPRFDLLVFRRFDSMYQHSDQSNRCRRHSDGSLAINCDRSYRRFGYRRFDGSLVYSTEHSRGDSVFAIVLGVFRLKNVLVELKCELVRGRNDNRYEQFEIYPEAIG